MKKFYAKKIILFCILLTFVSVIFQGYDYGISDHAEHFPALEQYFDNNLFSNDLIFGSGSFDPLVYRLLFYLIIQGISDFSNISFEVLIFTAHILARFFFFYMISLITYHLSKNNKAAIFAIIISAFFFNMPTLGYFKPLGSYFTPNLIIMPVLLYSIYLFLKNDYVKSFLFLALIVYFHLPTGVLMFIIFSMVLFYYFVRKEMNLNQLCRPILVFLLLSSYMLFLTYLFMSGGSSDSGFVYEESLLRLPHHALPSTFSIIHYIIFASYFCLCVFILFVFRRTIISSQSLLTFFISIALVLLISAFFIEILRIPFVIKLLPFRSTMFVNLLFPVIFSAAFFEALKRKSTFLILIFSAFIAFSTFYIFYSGGFSIKSVNIYKSITLFDEVALFAKDNTPVDSVFITPPIDDSFRYLSERAEVFNFRVTGYWSSDSIAREWINRLHVFCNVTDDFSGFPSAWEHCSEKYDNFSTDDFINLSEEYDADYIVVKKPDYLNLTLVYENEDYLMYSFG